MANKQINFSMNSNLHSAFKRELLRIRTAVTRIDLGDPKQRAGLVKRYDFFSSTLHHHHEGEDTYLWPQVRVKADPAEVVVLDAMSVEHGALSAGLDRLDSDFASIKAGEDDLDPIVIAAHLDDLQTILTGHCAHEERDGVVVVGKYLTTDDLKEFNKFNRGGEYSSLVLPWVCDGATPNEESTTWGMLPPFVRVFVRPVLNRKYRSFCADCGV